MREFGKGLASLRLSCALTVALALSACDQKNETQKGERNAPGSARNAAPTSIPMGGNKSVTRFFVTSKGLGKGGDLGPVTQHLNGGDLPPALRGHYPASSFNHVAAL
jgi:hypothetical protein